jgi:DNA gyrase subunit A
MDPRQLREAALYYHRQPKPGKIAVTPIKQLTNQYDLSMAYSPGVAAACEEIVADPAVASARPTPSPASHCLRRALEGFASAGCCWLKVYEIPEGTKNSKGRAIQNLLNIDSDDNVTAYLRVKSLEDSEFINSHYVLFCTKKGVIKKTLLEQYSRPRQNGVNAITIRNDDSVIEVRMTNGNNEIIIANRNGRAIRFHEAAVRVMGRTATGVRGITLDNDGQDEVVGMICIKDLETESVMVVSEQGYGKRSEIEDYRKTNRGGKGVKTMNITEKTGKLVTIKSVTDENDLMIINKSGITIRLKVADVRIMGRATQGVRLINLEKRNDQIGSVCKVMTESLEDEIPAEEAEGTIVSDPNADVPDIDDAADVNENESNNEIEE